MAGDKLIFEGIVENAMGNGNFLVSVENIEDSIHCTLSGRIRKNAIRIVEGDKVRIEVTPYDPSRGIIVYRMKG